MGDATIQVRIVPQPAPVNLTIMEQPAPVRISFRDEGSDTSFITGNANIRITASGIWLYNSTTLKWNQLLNTGEEGYEQLGLGAAASSPS